MKLRCNMTAHVALSVIPGNSESTVPHTHQINALSPALTAVEDSFFLVSQFCSRGS